MKPVVFDFFGTLFDITSIASGIEDVAGVEEGGLFLQLWRNKQLEYSYLMTTMGIYENFTKLTRRALLYAMEKHNLHKDEKLMAEMMDLWLKPEIYPDALPCLNEISEHSLSILSNGDPELLERGISNTPLNGMFSHLISVHEARVFKPHPAAYKLATSKYGVLPSEILFVSSNGWDIAGASNFGLDTVWVNRQHSPVESLDQRPQHVIGRLDGLPGLL